MGDERREGGRRSVEPEAKPQADEAVAVPQSAQRDRSWPLTDPMRLVRAERAGAAAQIGRSITAWRKPIAGAPLVIHRAKKKEGNQEDGTPGNNRAQNKQFNDAIQEIERRIGRNLSADDRRTLHDAITGQNMGYQDIVEEGISLFGKK